MNRNGMTALILGLCVTLGLGAVADSPAPREVRPGERPMTVLQTFPLTPEAYAEPVAALVRERIPEKYGEDEWASVVLTHEFHQHVGIYTVLGAKMAVRAREILKAPMRSVQVVAETGRKQPLSCLLDGLQVGLGSTMGQNLIEAPDTDSPRVAARFAYNGRIIRIFLKNDAAERIDLIIQKARAEYGDLTPAYFHAIGHATCNVWADFDRKEVFGVEKLPPAAK